MQIRASIVLHVPRASHIMFVCTPACAGSCGSCFRMVNVCTDFVFKRSMAPNLSDACFFLFFSHAISLNHKQSQSETESLTSIGPVPIEICDRVCDQRFAVWRFFGVWRFFQALGWSRCSFCCHNVVNNTEQHRMTQVIMSHLGLNRG